ncbi:hypothetical protein BDR06DRAFT_884594 [Suillus hirtellus]|nr:hypothetical protein BDR06DRAFT_884594 [Suillus hirtellus]
MPFKWDDKAQDTMNKLKMAIIDSPTIQPLNYHSGGEVILAVDSSYITCGWVLLQIDAEGHCCPTHFGSITWNKGEAHYSQAKIELYGVTN